MKKDHGGRTASHLPEWEVTQEIIACFYTVYNELGYGFLESVYRRSMAREIASRGIVVAEEVGVEAQYQGHSVGRFRLDLLVGDRVAVELKATPALGPTDRRQLLNYLRATTLDVGLLLHFGPTPKVIRLDAPPRSRPGDESIPPFPPPIL